MRSSFNYISSSITFKFTSDSVLFPLVHTRIYNYIMNRKDDRRAVAARHRSFHGGVAGQAMKKGVQPAPAWNERNMPQGAPGSKILLSNLPNDVGEEEVLVSPLLISSLCRKGLGSPMYPVERTMRVRRARP